MIEQNENPSEQEEEIVEKKRLIQTSAIFFRKLMDFLRAILSIREGTDIPGTIEEVRNNIVFKGPSVWILVCSILIASIGLNTNSTAIIIGAMLISPLMGPIIGIGLSTGTNNIKLLKRSLTNFGVMIIISLITSFIYFYLTPLTEAQSELLARTKPTLLDVMVAIFGGIAGIIAGSRAEKTNVIPGVAIATALMPPLCAAGYGLAQFNMEFFFGAFYLFVLNSIFICLSTIFIVRYLRFPLASFVDKNRERKVKRWITITTLLVIVPSAFIFWGIIKESIFKGKADTFVAKFCAFESTEVVSKNIYYSDSLSVIEIFLIGEIIPDSRIALLNSQMKKAGLKNTRLKVNQAKDESSVIAGKLSQEVRVGIIEDLYKRNEEMIQSKDEQIDFLERQLLTYKEHDIDYEDFKDELYAIYDYLEDFFYAPMISGSFKAEQDTVFTFLVGWNDEIMEEEIGVMNERLRKHLKARLKLHKLRIIDVSEEKN